MTVRVMISLPETFLAEIDRHARAEQRNRSEFFRKAVRFYIRAQEGKLSPGQLPGVQEAVSLQQQLAALMTGSDVDSIELLCRWREQRG